MAPKRESYSVIHANTSLRTRTKVPNTRLLGVFD